MRFEAGDRVVLVSMSDDPDPIPPGSEGTVTRTVSLEFPGEPQQEQVSVAWDSGRSLSCLVPPDELVRVDPDSP